MQTATVTSQTKWISLSVGGDDVGFGPIGLSCGEAFIDQVYVKRYSGTSCAQQLKSSNSGLGKLQKNLTTLYTMLLSKAPLARLVVVGYPQGNPIDLRQCALR